ncbi:MAG: hypothetical protein Q7T61_16350 [Caulobacter sp.]|nr:hypothetical protein [Caulobacter sp.]
MRANLLAVAATLVVAAPALAQGAVDSLTGFSQVAAACSAMVEAGGTAPAVASAGKAAGLVAGGTDTPLLQSHFFKDAARVDWWTRPTSDGRVQIGYNAAKGECRVFLFGVPRRDAAQRARNALPAGWFAYEDGKTWVRRRDDGTLTVMTVHQGDESKGVGPATLTALAHVWHNTAK